MRSKTVLIIQDRIREKKLSLKLKLVEILLLEEDLVDRRSPVDRSTVARRNPTARRISCR